MCIVLLFWPYYERNGFLYYSVITYFPAIIQIQILKKILTDKDFFLNNCGPYIILFLLYTLGKSNENKYVWVQILAPTFHKHLPAHIIKKISYDMPPS